MSASSHPMFALATDRRTATGLATTRSADKSFSLLHALIALMTGWGLISALVATRGAPLRNDFIHYYYGAKLVAAGQNPYAAELQPLIEAAGGEYDPRIPHAAHPPLLLRSFGLISWLELNTAYWVWWLMQVGLVGLFIELVRRGLGESWSNVQWCAMVALFLNCTALRSHFFYSQVQILVGCMIAGAYLLKVRGRPTAACGLATLATAFKLYPLVLMPWFAFSGNRSWGSFLFRCCASGGVAAVVLLITGIEPWLSFRELGLPVLHLHADTNPFNYSLYGMLASLTRVSSGTPLNDISLAHGGAAPAISIEQLMLLGSSLGISLAATAYAIIFLRGKELSGEIALSLLLVLMVSVGMVTWPHYMVLLAMPAAVLARHTGAFSAFWQRAACCLLAALALFPALDTCWWSELDTTFKMAVHYYPLLVQGGVAMSLLALARAREQKAN